MGTSRFLHPNSPGGLLTEIDGDELTAGEEAVVQAIDAGTFFVDDETPTGAIDGANTTFTLAGNPNPDDSLEVFLNGQRQTLTEDYTLSGSTLTMVVAPLTGSLLRVSYRTEP